MADTEAFNLYGADPADVVAAALTPLGIVIERPSWQREAACRGVGTGPFFGTPSASTEPADEMCAVCPVAGPCLDYALEHDLLGRWGGTSERTRRKLRRARRAEAA